MRSSASVSLAPPRAARLLLAAARQAGTLRTFEYDEDKHPRDDRGRWTDGGGGTFAREQSEGRAVLDRARAERGHTAPLDTEEQRDQQRLADAQTHPLAHPEIVLGLDQHNAEARRYVAAFGEEHVAAPLPADVRRGEPKECYKNASLLIIERQDLDYAEGFAQSSRTGELAFMHAWGVTKDGTVVDPTWDAPEEGKYFGVRYERAKYLKYLYKAKIYGVLGSTTKNMKKALETGGRALRKDLKALGGPGSGNFGHAGRPGEVGGSASDGGGGADHDAVLRQPASAYTPSRPDGLDTRERFSDGNGHYTPERAKLHDAIVAKYIKGTTPVDNPTSTILGGAPGVGKSTLVAQEGIGTENTVIISVDEIRNDLPEYPADPATGKRPASTAFTHEEASDISKKLMNTASKTGRNVVLDGTGDSSIEKLGGKVAVMRSRGQQVVAEYVTTSVEESQRRADARGQKIGRFVPPTAMREIHRDVSRVFPEAVRQGLFDRARLYDSTGRKPVLVASARRRELVIHDQALWDAFLAKGKP